MLVLCFCVRRIFLYLKLFRECFIFYNRHVSVSLKFLKVLQSSLIGMLQCIDSDSLMFWNSTRMLWSFEDSGRLWTNLGTLRRTLEIWMWQTFNWMRAWGCFVSLSFSEFWIFVILDLGVQFLFFLLSLSGMLLPM